ncbi:MAG: hypothetical protein ABI977_13400 [Acidobacteriota bacterium]
MAAMYGTEPIIEDDFERQKAELLKRAEEKPTLQMINSERAYSIERWQGIYPGLALFIEVTKEDFSQIYEGKLIATAKDSIEFLDLDKNYEGNGIVYLTAYGDPIDPRPVSLPPIFWFGTELPE